jgi:hypothetical protein
MKRMLKLAKRCQYYRDAKYLYSLLRRVKFRKAGLYLYYRFWVTSALRRSERPLDRPVDTQKYTLHVLCCHRDVSQMLWALGSWYAATSESPQLYIHDDGTFVRRDTERIHTLFPQAKIVDYHSTTRLARSWLADTPQALKLRTCRSSSGKRIKYPLAIKLIDPIFVSERENILILDTDILWFQEPKELVEAIYTYTSPVFWQDPEPWPLSFQNGEALREDLCYYNSGVVYYRKQDFDFAVLEEYLSKRGDVDEPFFGFNDQPAFAYTLGQYRDVSLLPTERYCVRKGVEDSTVSMHYLGPRRHRFWGEGVGLLLETFSSLR